MKSDKDLVCRAINGDRSAIGALIEKHYREVYSIALGISSNPSDAEDLTQEVFIKAYLKISQIENPKRFSSWLHTMARNHCRDWLRTHIQRYLPMDNLSAQEYLTFPPSDDKLLIKEFSEALLIALSSLKKDEEQILRLFYVYQFIHLIMPMKC
jgi:RNA polymerase sigma-70 factor (ECF subfamily)